MIKQSLQQVPGLAAVLLLVSLLTFLMLSLLPGDPALALLGVGATDEQLEGVREELGLNDPVHVRYVRWLSDVARLDLGNSYLTNEPVSEILRRRFPVTLRLAVVAEIIALAVAVPVAVFAAQRRDRRADKITASVMFGLVSVPGFVLAILLIYILAVRADLLPSSGLNHGWLSYVLPTLVLASPLIAAYQRVVRADLITSLQEPFILMARSLGLPRRRIVWRNALQPSLTTLITLIAVNLGSLIGGSVIVETVFGLPGVGGELVQAISAQDFPTVQAIVLLVGTAFVLFNFVAGLLTEIVDPRTRSVSR